MVEALVYYVIAVMPIALGHGGVWPLWELIYDGMKQSDANGDCTRKFCNLRSSLFQDGLVCWRKIRHTEEIRSRCFSQFLNPGVKFQYRSSL